MKKLLIPLIFIIKFIVFSQEIEVIGKSIRGEPIKVYKFGRGEELIIIVAGIHGNEKNTVNSAYEIINLLQKREISLEPNKMIWVIPIVNPDGFKENQRTNANNVDLNRNFFSENWKPKFVFRNKIMSAGDAPFSEPETVSLKNFFESIERNITTVVVSLHSKGDAIIPADDSPKNIELLNILRKSLSYTNIGIPYNIFGDMTQWLSEKLNIASVTIEFKTKTNNETEEIIKLIEILNKINFKEKIYKNDIFSFISNGNYYYKVLIESLPENVKENIKKMKNDENTFLSYFKKIDSENELLLLVNKSNHLSNYYVPEDLLTLSKKDMPTDKESFQIRKILIKDLQEMINDAKKDNCFLVVISAYRSYNTQKALYEYWVKKLGKEQADRVSAVAGASQHQLGTTIDFNSLDTSFENTKEGKWLINNAYKYGFVMSYPKNMEEITGYSYEPWHYRYVGKEASYLIYNFFDNCLEEFLNWYWDLYID